eukprot:TRINITY_DN5239_c0_g1_i1.p1 TRINITY_DN5239_c0_g1~~TRINITY_DN5239_c0_g1_i1.p1  ORF type:complete len:495 (-),score=71.47 TRINITY_DN5239_c0_g1_i1:51-1535(-)
MAPPRPSDAYVAKVTVRGSPPVLPAGSSSQAPADSKNTPSEASESKRKAPADSKNTPSEASESKRKGSADSSSARSSSSESSESKKKATSKPARPSSARTEKKMMLQDIQEDTSDDESVAGSEHAEGLPAGLSDFRAIRVGTSLTTSHFYGSTYRNKLTGAISMIEDRYMPPFTLVDLFGRKSLVMKPEELVEDEYLFRFEAMQTRTWMLHNLLSDPLLMAQNLGPSAGIFDKVLRRRVVDAPVSTGLRSPLMFWLPIVFLMGMTGDQNLVLFALVSTVILYYVSHSNNTPKRFQGLRWRSFPMRLLSVGIFVFQYFSNPENKEMMAMICILLSIGCIVLDFITGDLRMLSRYRLLCSYSIIHELPGRVFLCKRHGAAHLADVVGERAPIPEVITGTLWRHDLSLIADLNGLLVELRRPTLREARMMHEEYQDKCQDFGFLSVRTYSRDRPCFDALDPALRQEELDRIVERHKKEHALTWRHSTPEDSPQPPQH